MTTLDPHYINLVSVELDYKGQECYQGVLEKLAIFGTQGLVPMALLNMATMYSNGRLRLGNGGINEVWQYWILIDLATVDSGIFYKETYLATMERYTRSGTTGFYLTWQQWIPGSTWTRKREGSDLEHVPTGSQHGQSSRLQHFTSTTNNNNFFFLPPSLHLFPPPSFLFMVVDFFVLYILTSL